MLGSHVSDSSYATIYDGGILTKFVESQFTTMLLRYNRRGIAVCRRNVQVIAITSCDSGSSCDHFRMFKTFAGQFYDCQIAGLVAA